MGYHVTILRTKAGNPIPISLEEAKEALEAIGFSFTESDASFTLRHASGDESVLWFQNGEVWTQSPSDECLALMIQAAKVLEARVRGDENETYRTVQDCYSHPDDSKLVDKAPGSSKLKMSLRGREWLTRITLASTVALISYAVSWMTS